MSEWTISQYRAARGYLAENPSWNASGVRAYGEGVAARVWQESGGKAKVTPMDVVPTLATPMAVARRKRAKSGGSDAAFDSLDWDDCE